MSTLPNRTKIVATLGPASENEKVLGQLIKAGANVFRVNCSHSDAQGIIQKVQLVRKVARKAGAQVGVLADLQGPKMRVGPLKDNLPIQLDPGASLVIVADRTVVGEAGSPHRVGTGYEALAEDVKPGERILIDDGNIEVRVDKIRGREVHTSVIYGGNLKSFKGINLPGTAVSAKSMSPKDIADLGTALDQDVDFIALSFVRTASELHELRERIRAAGKDAKIVSKIERPEAIDNLEAIIEESDGVMVARGDMGVELGPEWVPSLQKRIIRLSLKASKPVITATQMLESMITNPRPTRAEASDVANAIHDGTSAVMLSAETAAGDYPVRTVEIMSRIIRHTESELFEDWAYSPLTGVTEDEGCDVTIATVRAAAYAAVHSRAKAIAIFTDSGSTARHLAKERVGTPIWAFTPNEETRQQLALSWGINATTIPKGASSHEETLTGERVMLESGLVQKGDRVVMVFGTTRDPGMTNIMHVRTL